MERGRNRMFGFFNRKRREKSLRDEDDRELFVQRYRAFREVLKNNNNVLMTVADMQEKAGGAFVFDKAYVESSYQAVAGGVKQIIKNLNVLANEKYKDLSIPYQKIDAAIRKCLGAKVTIPKTDYVIALGRLGKENIASAGGKIACLGELANALRFPVPSGFVVTTYAYQAFVEHNNIQDILHKRTKRLDIRNYDELTATSHEMQKLIRNGHIPAHLEEAVFDAYRSMCQGAGEENLKVSVRSSALHEDIMASFAGQYKTTLNVHAEDLLVQYKNVLSSQFTPRALFYYKDKGFDIEEMAMAVGVLAMIQAKASGIMYSRDPDSPQENATLISAVWGLGTYAVGGVVTTQDYKVSGKRGKKIKLREAGSQEAMLVGRPEGGTEHVALNRKLLAARCLSDEQISSLASYAREAETHFGQPQDMEWAIDQEDRLYLLQSRPLRLASPETLAGESRPRVAKGHKILLNKGTIACRGVGAGPVYVVNSVGDLADFPEGGVLVVKHAHPEFSVILQKASAVVADIGTVLGHLAKVAGEYNVPAIFNTETATGILKNGMRVTVDAEYATVYEGIVEEVLRVRKIDAASKVSSSLKQLQEILQMITPLNLTDPQSPHFKPSRCKTLHDITRFAHEVSMQAMFHFSQESYFSARSTKQLVCDVPMQWWIIDLEDGIKEGVKGKKVRLEEIVSTPMQALWRGMTAVPWKGPPPIDTKGFLSAVFRATTDPSIDPAVRKRFTDKNYIILSKHFCNLSCRLGFHFSTAEAYVGDNPNENYISFIFKGGVAPVDRRVRRIQFIGKLLERFDFRIEIKYDSILARLEGHNQDFLLDHLKVLGHIIIHTRSLDMVMFNEATANWYYDDMLKGIESFVRVRH
jgi:pyruvate,water dikinase